MIARTRVAPPMPASARPWYYVGLDLGQASDNSALAVAERDRPPPVIGDVDPGEACYALSWLHRWPLKTSYPAIVRDVAVLVRRLAAREPRPELRFVVDMTGVGRPVIDLLRREQLPGRLVPVTIHGGDAVAHDADGWRVPKRQLVSTTQVLLQGERLKIASALPDATTLTAELLNFQVKISEATGHDSYASWREGQHDDLVLAAALALWHGETERLVPEQPPSQSYVSYG